LPVSAADNRPPPEHFLQLIQRQQRGRLKIYLGFAAGVGKTYEMLQEGHRLKKQGVDVVVGYVETHGRAETAARVEGLPQGPGRAPSTTASPWKRWISTPSWPAVRRSPWWTNWPTPTPPAAGMASATRTSRICSGPGSTSSAP